MDVVDRFRADAKAIRGFVGRVAQQTRISEKTLRGWQYGRDPRLSGYRKLRDFYAVIDETRNTATAE